ncbi:MAG: phenylalanine--tRNA ligase subunit alpha, partial [Roseomonas sp.]|nr:phenylalanine--tRNA ligase subunit alpha [Roseomonas sp.]
MRPFVHARLKIMNDPKKILSEIEQETQKAVIRVETSASVAELETLRVSLLGSKGQFKLYLAQVGRQPAEIRSEYGRTANVAVQAITTSFESRRAVLEQLELNSRLAAERMDVSLPSRPVAPGTAAEGGIHPIARTMEELTTLFGAMGFKVAEGPDIESDWHNFGALNIPDHHPARQDHDTFYLPAVDGRRPVLRTHTSPVQIRTMLTEAPPIRVIVPGRTYRADHDATHSPMFHQVEGLVIDRNIHLGHLKGCLIDFLRAFFGIGDLPVRFRASYFPFTEPSMEVDIGWSRKTGELGKGGDWLEILGSGMVHPKVLANCGIDPREWQGFAFGMGIERITMLKHGIPDLRPFYEADIRWLRHYGADP